MGSGLVPICDDDPLLTELLELGLVQRGYHHGRAIVRQVAVDQLPGPGAPRGDDRHGANRWQGPRHEAIGKPRRLPAGSGALRSSA
jgi:hypothetical protein